MKKISIICLVLGSTAVANTAQAQLVVQGKGDAAQCYQYAARGNTGSNEAVRTCTEAFSVILTRKDEAATFVNRGVLYMRSGNQELASQDYQSALALNPNLAEAHVNYAASLIRLKKYDAAIESLEKALVDPKSSIRPEALYNRAIIFDYKENYKGAYHDLKAALAIRPNWEPALDLISQYEVRPAG